MFGSLICRHVFAGTSHIPYNLLDPPIPGSLWYLPNTLPAKLKSGFVQVYATLDFLLLSHGDICPSVSSGNISLLTGTCSSTLLLFTISGEHLIHLVHSILFALFNHKLDEHIIFVATSHHMERNRSNMGQSRF